MIRGMVRGIFARDDSEAAMGTMQSHMKMTPNDAPETYRVVRKACRRQDPQRRQAVKRM